MADYWKELNRPPAVPGVAGEEFLVPSNAKLNRQMRLAAGWLWVYAALSTVNVVLAYIHAPIRMAISLVSTDLFVAVGLETRSFMQPVALVAVALVIGVTVIVAWFAHRCAVWAFWIGILLLAADAIVNYLVTTLAGVFPFLLHGVAIWFLVLGLKAAKLHRERKATGKA